MINKAIIKIPLLSVVVMLAACSASTPYQSSALVSLNSMQAQMNKVEVTPLDSWPVQNKVDSMAYEAIFIKNFLGAEAGVELAVDRSQLQSCHLPAGKDEKIAGLSKEVIDQWGDGSSSINIHSIAVSSTVRGCQQLAITPLSLKKNGYSSAYDFQQPFNEPIYIASDYTMKMATIKVRSLYNRYRYVDPNLEMPVITIAKALNKLDANAKPSLHMNAMAQVGQEPGEIVSVGLMRMTVLNKTKNTITIIQKQAGEDVTHSFNSDGGRTRMRGGKLDGLLISSSYTKTGEMNTACYKNSKSIDVFKELVDGDCEAVDESRIGEPGVNVSAVYKITHKNKSARVASTSTAQSKRTQVSNNYVEQLRRQKAEQERQQRETELAAFQKKQLEQPCPINDTEWAYISGECVKEKPEGKGEAVSRGGVSFAGDFKAGIMTRGKLSKNGEMIFDGQVLDAKPHGMGMCVYQGEFEECKYYQGQRVDTLYKMRKQMTQQKEAIDRQTQELAQQRKELNQLKNQPRANTNSGGSSLGKSVQDELVKQGTRKLLDQLF